MCHDIVRLAAIRCITPPEPLFLSPDFRKGPALHVQCVGCRGHVVSMYTLRHADRVLSYLALHQLHLFCMEFHHHHRACASAEYNLYNVLKFHLTLCVVGPSRPERIGLPDTWTNHNCGRPSKNSRLQYRINFVVLDSKVGRYCKEGRWWYKYAVTE
jgi:hypothetical protein